MNVSSFGAIPVSPTETRFRLWAPAVDAVSLEIEGVGSVPMSRLEGGWHEVVAPCRAGAPYRYRVRPDLLVPDPASRGQAGDVHDASLVVDPLAYVWQCADWRGRPWHEAVIYELHVGAMGGFAGVRQGLPRLAALGVTAVELMPVADFPGPRNWGYDGVLPYAPDAAYGTPDDLRCLVDTAHRLGLMVFLDVVYNHFGPDGNYISAYAPEFYRSDRTTPWGDSIDFRQPAVRRFFIENALHWLHEYRIDGLRFDAIHAIADPAFLREMAQEIRADVGTARHVHLVVENEANDAALLRAAPDERTFDAQWADDFHHCIHVLLTGEREGYYADFAAQPAVLLARALAEGFAFQGEPSAHAGGARRGTPSAHLPPTSFVFCLQNHDQVGNRALGERLCALADPGALRVATVLLLLSPHIPMLFMGEEWAAAAPFQFFTSFTGDLAEAVREGRRQEFSAFSTWERRDLVPDPNDPATFAASRADDSEAASGAHAAWLELHRALLAIRRDRIVPRLPGTSSLEAHALGDAGVYARWRMGDGAELSIAANFGDSPLPCPPLSGSLLFATHGLTDMAPPHSAFVTLSDGDP